MAAGLEVTRAHSVVAPRRFFNWALALYLAVIIGRVHEMLPILSRLYIGKVSAALLIAATAMQIKRPDVVNAAKSQTAKYLFALTLLALLSVPGSAWPRQSFSFFTDWWPQVLLLFVCVCAGFANRRTAFVSVFALTATAALAAFLMLTRQALGGRAFIGDGMPTTYDANMSAAFLVAVLPYPIMLARWRGAVRWVCLAIIPILIAGILKTASRGGIIALGVVGLSMLWLVGPRYRKAYLLVLVVVLALVPAMPHQQLVQRWDELNTATDYNFTARGGRLEIWKRGIGFMTSHPLLGVGVRAYEVAGGITANSWLNAHNALIQIGAELGIGGLVLFLLVIAAAFRAGFRVRRWSAPASGPPRESDLTYLLATAAICSLIGTLSAAMFLSMAYDALTIFTFAVPTGLALVAPVAAARPVRALSAPTAVGTPGWRTNRRLPAKGLGLQTPR